MKNVRTPWGGFFLTHTVYVHSYTFLNEAEGDLLYRLPVLRMFIVEVHYYFP